MVIMYLENFKHVQKMFLMYTKDVECVWKTYTCVNKADENRRKKQRKSKKMQEKEKTEDKQGKNKENQKKKR